MSRLDEIKERAKVVATKPENREATYAEFGAVLRLACFDVPALVAAVEAVLAIHTREADGYGGWMCATCLDDERGFDPEREPYPCPTVAAIRDALGETE